MNLVARSISGELVTSIGKAHGKTGAQVSLRWLAQRGVPLSTKSTNAAHLRDAIDVFRFSLSSDEMARLDHFVNEPPESYSFTCECKATQSCGPHGGGDLSPYA